MCDVILVEGRGNFHVISVVKMAFPIFEPFTLCPYFVRSMTIKGNG